MTEPRITYYAVLDDGGAPDSPIGIVRRIHKEPPIDETFRRDMTWHPTDYLRRYYLRGSTDTDHVEIDAESARAILDRWCANWIKEDRARPVVGTVDAATLNAAVVIAIKGSKIPRIDATKLAEEFGQERSEALFQAVSELVREAVRTPIEWGDLTLEQGVNDILRRFHDKHPELSPEALHEIGRCVGWNLR